MTRLDDGITAIDTEYARPLLDASHLISERGRAAFVDTGANSSVPLLLDALAQQDLDPGDVDYVFLTHIHLDHAGGAGLLMQALPNARCVVHPRGAPHMIAPAKLIAGTEAVYGVEATRKMYGVIQPLDERRVVTPDDGQQFDLNGRELRTFYTEGHALHHYCIDDPASHGVFTGDSFGVSYRELDTAAGPFIFPASTPTHFDPVAAHKSVDLIMGCNPDYVYLTHYSRVGDLARLAQDMHEGIDAYAAIAHEHKAVDDPFEPIRVAMQELLSTRLRKHGYRGDDAAMQSILRFDIELNAKGLVSWLLRLKKQG
ncbi:MAG: MBL fold metallo-hydrolase [Gammaproteobacteria bacterium]|nr:MBL fold metallo-hydrolase [Gammaproteobacteria bacterium]